MKQQNEAAAPPNETEQSRLQRLFGNQRFLMVFSLFLAVIVWVVFVVVNGEDQTITINGVPVRMNYEGSAAQQLELQPFWSDGTGPEHLTVSVTVTCKPYENVRAGDLDAVLMTNNVTFTGEHTLPIHVSPRQARDRNRFTVDSVTPDAATLYFAQSKTLPFDLEYAVEGEILVPEGYCVADTFLSRRTVSVSGPASYVNAISRVKAVILPEGVLGETTVFEDIDLVPVDAYGDALPFLTVESGEASVSATVLVWKEAELRPAVDFIGAPGAYSGVPPKYAVTPASVRAALPEAALEELSPKGVCGIGQVSFRELAPGRSVFRFPAEDLKEIVFPDGTREFTVRVDMTGMDTARLTLPGGAVAAAAPNEGIRFRDVPNVTVVGPAESVKDLRAEDLSGLAEVPEDAGSDSSEYPLSVYVNRDDCWVYGEYKARIR